MKTNKLFFTARVAAACLGLWLAALLPAQAQTQTQTQAQTQSDVARQYAALVHASYEDTLAAARALQQAVHDFLAAPSDTTLQAARQRWLAAREWYGQTEAYRFYGGPIDDARNIEGRLNAWPMDESYVDGVKDKPNAGLVNNRKAALTKKGLAALNERGGEENIATGWHAIEFMLWGQDLYDDGPGRRDAGAFIDAKAPNADRRRQYLRVVTELLLDDLATLVKDWAPGAAKNYRAGFERRGNEALRRMLVGLGSLSRGELAGERLEVALASQDQEDEHSCFSDNTHRDVVANALGIQNVWLGRYKRADGTLLQGASLRARVAAKDAALAERVSERIAASVAAAEAIPPPFDRAIRAGAPGRDKVQATADRLREQSRELVAAAGAIGIVRLQLVDPK